MLPTNFFLKEILEDLKGRRSLIFKFGLPMLLIAPLALLPVPQTIRASVISILILFLGVFGSAVGLAKLKESGLLERLIVTPVSKRSMMGQYILANSFMDSLQLGIPLLLLSFQPTFPWSLPEFTIAFLSAILASNALGAVVAVASGSSGEVHLFATLTVLVVAVASGLFMSFGGVLSEISSASPFNQVSVAFLALWQVSSNSIWAVGILVSFLIFSLSLLLANRFFRI